jgi:hypothetical protein
MFRLAVILALVAIPAKSEQCHDKEMLEAFLKHEHGLQLHSWGLSDSGNMLELWLGSSGHWAVVTTTPWQCSTVQLPHDLKGRLWVPPSHNYAVPEDRMMNKGQGL